MTTYTLRRAGSDDLAPADYRDACAERIYITAQNERQRREGNRP
jgi:hypothetical protein